jgi:homocitrate synthase NifV
MTSRRFIVDTTLRDGEQAPYVSFTREEKLHIFRCLDDAEIDQIEAGTPASGESDRAIIREMLRLRKYSRVSVWSRLNPEDLEACLAVKPDVVHISIPASYTHIYVRLRKNKQWVMSRLCECLGVLDGSGVEISAGFEDASRADMSFVIAVSRVLSDFGVSRIRLADTVGVLYPSLCRETVKSFLTYADRGARLGFHGHNDYGMALANTIEMLKSGCLWADTSLGGYGERAGNCDFAALVRASSRIFEFGISPDEAAALTRRALPGRYLADIQRSV